MTEEERQVENNAGDSSSGQEDAPQPQDSENQPEGYPPTSIQFEGIDAATKGKDPPEGEGVDLSEFERRDSGPA